MCRPSQPRDYAMIVLHVVDAFADRPFRGNPAAVCVLQAPLADDLMQSIAAEMNLSETAFVLAVEGGYALRWFTPAIEVALCGHATLASAHILWELAHVPATQSIRFHTMSGWLSCSRANENWIEMDFPAKTPISCPVPEGMESSLGSSVRSCSQNGMDYLVEVENESILRSLQPNYSTLSQLPVRGVIVTCRSDTEGIDFVSRFFAPAAGVNEDPVTGSAHCALGPYWESRLNKSTMVGYQASQRGGIVRLTVTGERVLLRGQAITFSRVEVCCDIVGKATS
jgi:PhzF family phenazine biosynthesis protein